MSVIDLMKSGNEGIANIHGAGLQGSDPASYGSESGEGVGSGLMVSARPAHSRAMSTMSREYLYGHSIRFSEGVIILCVGRSKR
jgi:hypothetical protein